MSAPVHYVIATEVHRKALENVAKEMAISLVRTSGSPVVVESKDYSTCVMDTVPEHLSVGMTTIPHIGSSLVGTRAVTATAQAGEIEPGAGWMVNDPHTGGALHQADISIIMPTFYGDEHVGWSFVNTHILDVGGSGISGFAPGATDIYQEGLLFPAARVIRDGAIEPVWRRFIAANVRTPAPVLNDLRSMIAANNTASRKMVEIIDRYGLETHRELCERGKTHTEDLLRQRIAALPDGVYEAVDWTELRRGVGDEQLLELRMTLQIDGSDARFTLSGDPQVDAFVNGTRGVVLGWLVGEVARVLGYGDLPLNGGFWRPIHVDLGPPGTIVNSVSPAPVGNGHGAIGCRVSQLTRDVLTQAAALSDAPDLRARVAGRGVDSFPAASWFGTSQHGKVAVMFYVDNAMGIGGAAQTVHDGQDTFGIGQALGGGIADVETHEASDPLLFLWRRLVPDTGAPGTTRGGLGLEQAYTLQFADVAAGPLWNHGRRRPGSPACCATPTWRT
jgi:N-methylhydantoinase B